MKKIITTMLTMSMLIAFASCSKNDAGKSAESSAVQSQSEVGMANPWTDNKDLKEANANAGTKFVLPDEYKSERTVYRSMAGKMIEIRTYADDAEVMFRSKNGAKAEDISGDYNNYSKVRQIRNNDITVDLKSNTDGKVSLASWNDGNANYCINFASEIAEADAIEVISSIIEANTNAY